MSQSETDVADNKSTNENPESSINEADPLSENTLSCMMEAADSSKDDTSSVQDQLKADSKEAGQTSSSGNESSLLNIVSKDPEKDIKDESNKTTDSPKRVKLVRPEFDKEKLAQKIREIEEREKLKMLNKMKEQERMKSEKSAAESSRNKTDDAKKQDTLAVAANPEVSVTLDNKNVVQSDKEDEKSSSKTIDSGKSCKIDDPSKEDSVPDKNITQDNDVSPQLSGRQPNEECKVSTSVQDTNLDSKNHEKVDKKVKCDSELIPGTNAPENQKKDGNIDMKTKGEGKVESEKTIESDDQVSSTVEEDCYPSIVEKNANEKSTKEKEQKVESKQQISVPEVETSISKAGAEETSRSQIQVEIESAVTETFQIASISRDVDTSTGKQKPVANIEKKDIKEQEKSDVCKRTQNTGIENVFTKATDSGELNGDSSEAVNNEKKKEDSIEKKESTAEKIIITMASDENTVKEQQPIKRDVKKIEECSVLKNVTDEDRKSKVEQRSEEDSESKTKAGVSKHVMLDLESELEKTVSVKDEKGLTKMEKHSEKNEVDGEIGTVEPASSINVQKSIESVLDELTVEPSKDDKKIGNLSALEKEGLDTAPDSQESSSNRNELMHVDESSNKSEDILLEIEKFIDSSAERNESTWDSKNSGQTDQKLVESTVKTGEKIIEVIQKSDVDLSSREKRTGESKNVSSSMGGEKSTAVKRKLDNEINYEGAKKKFSSEIVHSVKSLESDKDDDLTSHVNSDVEKLAVFEQGKKISDESKYNIESELKQIDKENKEETSIDDDDDDKDKSSSDVTKDVDEMKSGSKETPPLESILDSIIDFEPEPTEVPEEDLVISDVPSTALVESKIPESPRRVKLVRPSKPATKTLTKPEITQKISQSKPVEPKVMSESKVEKEVSLKPIEKFTSEKSQDVEKERDMSLKTTKEEENGTKKEEAKTFNIPQSGDTPIELENKQNASIESLPDEKMVAAEVDKSSSVIEVNPPTEKATTSNAPCVEKKLTTDENILEKTPISAGSSTVKTQQKLKEMPKVETPESDILPESVEKTLPNKPSQPQEKVIRTKELSKDRSSEKLPLEKLVQEKTSEKELEICSSSSPKPSKSLEESNLLESTQPIQNIVPEKVDQPAVKSETVETSSTEKPAATPKLTPSEEIVKECVAAKELTEKLTDVPKISEIASPEKIDILKSPSEKSPVESETAKLRRIIRKPRTERVNESKQANVKSLITPTDKQGVQSVESKQIISPAPKQLTSEGIVTDVKKVSAQENVALDMTVDEEDDDSNDRVVTSDETKQEAETKQLGFKLKIAKSSTTIIPKEVSQSATVTPILAEKLMSQKPTEHTFGSITISATSRDKHQTDMKKVEEMLKDTDVTITPLVDRDPTQKLSKITVKIGKDGNPPEIKQMGERWNADVVKRKPGEDGGSPSRKKLKDESAVLTTSSGVEIDLHMKKPKLLSSLISEPPMTSQDPRLSMTPQQMMSMTPQQSMGMTPQQSMSQQMMSQLTPQQTNIFLGTPQSAGMFQSSLVTPGSEVVKKKRGRPRKIPLPEGQLPQDQQLQALKQQIMMQSQQGSSGTGTSSGSGGSDEYSSGVFPQVPLFDMTESLFDQPHLFPNQVTPTRGRPQRQCRGRIKLPSVRSRKPRGSTLALRAGRGTGRGRGRGLKRQFTENDNIITLENVKEEMRRQSLEQAQFMGSNEPMETMPLPQTPQEPLTQAPAVPTDPAQDTMKSPERKPRKRKNEEEERERIEKIKQRREEKKMKTLEKKRKIAEAKAKEKAAVMAAALVEEETRMSAPERKEEEKKKDVKTEKKMEGETDVSLVEEPSQPESIRVAEPEEVSQAEDVSQQSIETKEPVEFAKELIEFQEPSTPISKPDLEDLTTASADEPVKVEPSSFQDIKKESSTNTDTVEPSSVTPRKERKVYRCLICREESPLKKLTSPLDHRSWRVLYQAAIVRGHEEIINLTKNLSDEIPTGILYHRNCRSEFTHKKTLAKLTDCPITEDHQPIAAKTPGAENINPNTPNEVRMDGSITEYQWPLQGGELYMIQEQVSDFLEITSFKRKYPDIARRTVEPEEKAYLRDNGLVSEAHCDLGLIAVKSSDVLDIMFADFQDKYEEFRKQIRDKQARELSSKHKAAFTSLLMDKRKFDNRVLDAKTEAMQAVASWNSRLNKMRVEQRRCMLDLQSMIVHYPKTVGIKRSQVPNPPGKVGHYPIALVPGQFCDNYKRYNPNELKYFPLNTVIYGPMKPNERHGGGSDGSQSDSDDSSSSDDSSDTSSESSEDSDASCDDTNEKDVKERQPSGETHCKVCGGDKTRNKQDNPEVLINCAQCTKSSQLIQLNRLPTVLLSNLNIRNTARPSQTQSSLSKLIKPVVSSGSPSPIKRLKTENSSIGTATFINSPKPSFVQPLKVQQSFKVQEAQNVRTQEIQGIKVQGTQSINVQGTQSINVQGTQNVRTLDTQGIKVQGIQDVRTQETQSLKVQNAQNIKIQETQSIKVQGIQDVRTQETQSIKIQGAQDVRTQETQSIKTLGTQDVRTQETQSIKVPESQNFEVQESQNNKAQGTQSIEVKESQSMEVQGSQSMEVQESQSIEVHEPQSMEVQESQSMEVQESQSMEVQESQSMEVQESQSMEVQESQSMEVQESQSMEVQENQSAIVQETPQNIQETQSFEAQVTQTIEVKDTQNVESQAAQCAKPLPDQVMSSDSNTSNSTNSTIPTNTDSMVDSVEKSDTVSSTVNPVETESV